MKKFFTLLLTTILSAFCISFVAEAAIVINDYTMPKDLPEKYKSSLFSVLVEGEVIDTYKVGLNAWNNEVACCEFSSVDSVGITVTTNFSFSSKRCRYSMYNKWKSSNIYYACSSKCNNYF